MQNNFDLKKFLIENRLTRLSENEEDDFNEPIEAPPEWNKKDLKPGTVIPKSVWNKQAILDYFGEYNSWEELVDEFPSEDNLVNNSWKFNGMKYDPSFEQDVITLVNINNPNEKQTIFKDQFNVATNSKYDNYTDSDREYYLKSNEMLQTLIKQFNKTIKSQDKNKSYVLNQDYDKEWWDEIVTTLINDNWKYQDINQFLRTNGYFINDSTKEKQDDPQGHEIAKYGLKNIIYNLTV